MKKVDTKGRWKLYVPIYHIETELYIGEGSIPSTMEIETDGMDGNTQVLERDGNSKVVIWLRKMDWTSTDIGLLTHELLHAVNKIFYLIGIEDPCDEEISCYLLQYLVTNYSRKINKKSKLLKEGENEGR